MFNRENNLGDWILDIIGAILLICAGILFLLFVMGVVMLAHYFAEMALGLAA